MENFITKIIDKDLSINPSLEIKTRFPPEPNGYLHIGHVKSIWLNNELAVQYNGKCNLRFDDTNPVKEDIEFINSIKDDIAWLGYDTSSNIHYASDYFEQFFEYAVRLIKMGKAYIDHQSPDEIAKTRGTLTESGIESPCRDRPIEESFSDFIKMRQGEFPERACCLRAKIDMSSSFLVLRDPVIYRIKYAHHHQTGDKWCIYPMYDFAHCLSDYIENISHSLCSLEFQDNRRLYDWVLDELGLSQPVRPRQYEFSRLNFDDVVLSKRKLTKLVEEKHVSGWSDPKMPTVSGLRNRGFTPSSIKEFISQAGITKQNYFVSFSLLENVLRKELETNATRALAVINPLKVVITNLDGDYVETLQCSNHPKQEMGHRDVAFSNEIYIDKNDFKLVANKKFKRLIFGGEVRLRGAYVMKANDYKMDLNGDISMIYCTIDKETLGKNTSDGRKVKGVIHWVCAKNNASVIFRLFNKVFNTDGLVANDATEEVAGYVESSVVESDMRVHYQFERVGYFIQSVDNPTIYNGVITLRESFSKD
ncbi:glutamine--tRNA ligase/YqeY domain fusion protein [Candidatus Enterovibrio escicola]|uniref:glutamine--tRNA ligase/YqeY domain fusion protein n=2 Tax=Candidatus Enterovibrio escicola TaxID=1927127 RepID=UPI00123830C3|nr:glutamine--tRNA ligase/YqeY domain fusion protein [Candidatus Enterovibrio escacola]